LDGSKGGDFVYFEIWVLMMVLVIKVEGVNGGGKIVHLLLAVL
jgi:hypothetical protein